MLVQHVIAHTMIATGDVLVVISMLNHLRRALINMGNSLKNNEMGQIIFENVSGEGY